MKTLAMFVAWAWVMGVLQAQEDVALVGNAFVPEEIPGLKCNLDAYQFRTLTNGASVGTWLCEKTGITVTNSTASQQPKYQITNGFGFLRFDGVDDFLRQPIGQEYPSGTTNRIHSICVPFIGATGVMTKGAESFGSGWSFYMWCGYLVTNDVAGYFLTTAFEPVIKKPFTNDSIAIVTDSNPVFTWYQNGSFKTNSTNVGPYRTSTLGLAVGHGAAVSIKNLTQVPQILIYSNTLSFIQRKHVEEYLSSRYKIPNISRQ